MELGGFAMPSIAIVKASEGHSDFGNISIVFGKDTIDPQANRTNKVYSADAWTPIVTGVENKLNNKVLETFGNKVSRLSKTMYNGLFYRGSAVRSKYSDVTYDSIDAIIDALARDTTVQAAYLAEKGIVIDPVCFSVNAYHLLLLPTLNA